MKMAAWTFSPSAAIPTGLWTCFTDDPLLEGSVDYLEDEDSLLDPRNRDQLIELYEVCYTLLFSGMPANLAQCPQESLSFAIASALPLDLLWKQQILEVALRS